MPFGLATPLMLLSGYKRLVVDTSGPLIGCTTFTAWHVARQPAIVGDLLIVIIRICDCHNYIRYHYHGHIQICMRHQAHCLKVGDALRAVSDYRSRTFLVLD